MESITAVYDIIRSGALRIVVTFHQKPDADAMGSGLGLWHYLRKLGHQVVVISPTNWAPFLNWMPGVSEVVDFDSRQDAAKALVAEADLIFCLDYNTLSRTRHMETCLREAKGKKILIDHHQEPETAVFAYGESNTAKSSTAEMVYDFIVASGGSTLIDTDIATCLYAGAMTDTGSFRFPSTTASVHRMVAHLKDVGIEHHKVHENLFDTFLENRLRFFGHVMLHRLEIIYELNTAIIAIPKADLVKFNIQTGDTEGLVNYPLSIQGIRLAAICIDRDEERKWSFRSKGDVDVNEFARKYFEGGGHRNAAGGRSSESLEKTVATFYEKVKALQPVLADYEVPE